MLKKFNVNQHIIFVILFLIVGLLINVFTLVDDYKTKSLQVMVTHKKTYQDSTINCANTIQASLLGINPNDRNYTIAYLTPLDKLMWSIAMCFFGFMCIQLNRKKWDTATLLWYANRFRGLFLFYFFIKMVIRPTYRYSMTPADYIIDTTCYNGFIYLIISVSLSFFIYAYHTNGGNNATEPTQE